MDDLRIVKGKKKQLEGGLTQQAAEYHRKLQREAFYAGAAWAAAKVGDTGPWEAGAEAETRYP